MNIIDGRLIAQKIYKQLQNEITSINFKPKLGIILASNDEASRMYVKKMKIKKALALGIDTELKVFTEDVIIDDVLKEIQFFNKDKSINGILVQVPFYSHLEKERNTILNAINPTKDADGLSALNLGLTSQLTNEGLPPATVDAIIECIKYTINQQEVREEIFNEFLTSKQILIINNTTLIGKPLALILSTYNATVTISNKFTKNLKELCLSADIIISATNQTNIIDYSMIKKNAILIDVTSNKVGEKVIGDIVLSDKLIEKTGWLTPVPGGVGPVTIACLMRNVIRLGKLQQL